MKALSCSSKQICRNQRLQFSRAGCVGCCSQGSSLSSLGDDAESLPTCLALTRNNRGKHDRKIQEAREGEERINTKISVVLKSSQISIFGSEIVHPLGACFKVFYFCIRWVVFSAQKYFQSQIPRSLLSSTGGENSSSPLGTGSISTEWKIIWTTAKNDQHHPSLTNLETTISPKPAPFLEKLSLQ